MLHFASQVTPCKSLEAALIRMMGVELKIGYEFATLLPKELMGM
jgi:hypothetical protein